MGNGTVTFAGVQSGYGTMVDITHSDGTVVRYAHMSSISVSISGLRGSTSPLQSGQWSPQPAPEPVART